MARFDPARLADLVAEESRLRGAVAEVAMKLNDQYATDTWDESRQATYAVDQQRHAQLARELQMVRSERQACEQLAPPPTPQRPALARWLAAGPEGLEAAERNLYLGDATLGDRTGAAGPGAHGAAFLLGRSLEGAIDSNTLRSDNDSGAGVVQPEVRPDIVDRLAYYGGVGQMARHIMTATGSEYRIPTEDATSQTGEVLDDQSEDTSPLALGAIGTVTMRARTISSRVVPITREMIQDSVVDIEAYVERQLVRRIGRISDSRMTVTPGGAQMDSIQGVASCATPGVTAASQTVITWPEVTELIYSVNRAYREGGEGGEGGFAPPASPGAGRVGYLLSDGAERALRVMVDGDSRPLWVPSTREGAPSMIGGHPYAVSGSMADPAAGTIPILFGDFAYFAIRTVRMVEVFRITDSTTLARNSVHCLAFARRDARPVGAITSGVVTEAIAKLTMAA